MAEIVLRGGYNKHSEKSRRASVLYAHADKINDCLQKGGNVVVVTCAKPDGYFGEMILDAVHRDLKTIGRRTRNAEWGKYDLVFLMGGSNYPLLRHLRRLGFDTDMLKEDCLLIGDSAGAMVLSAWVIVDETQKGLKFERGLNDEWEFIVVPHTDNPAYVTPDRLKEIREFARGKGCGVVEIKENEEVCLEDII